MGQVPDNWDYGLRDVKDAIGGGVESLRDCFDNAHADGFDPDYEGNKDSLRSFRNYNHDVSGINFTVVVRDSDLQLIEGLAVKISDELYGDTVDSGVTDANGEFIAAVPSAGDWWVELGGDEWTELKDVQDGDVEGISYLG